MPSTYLVNFSGPEDITISNPISPGVYEVTYNAAGVYTFRCTVTDPDGNSDSDDTSTTVKTRK